MTINENEIKNRMVAALKQVAYVKEMLLESEKSVPEDEARYQRYTVSLESASHEFVSLHMVKPDRTPRKQMLSFALSKITEQQRKIIILVAVHKKTRTEVAKLMNCSIKNICKHYNNGINTLIKELSKTSLKRR